ncbi:MAG TPA: hypothetical protein VKU80_04205 [Planctomycetota bacterium]|nr:hypothetical protein [Planctomycetota bacterium]
MTDRKRYLPDRYSRVTGVIDITGARTQIFVDERLMDTRGWSPAKAVREFGSKDWRIGSNAPGSDTYRWARQGVVGDVRLGNRALGPEDVDALFKAESAVHER